MKILIKLLFIILFIFVSCCSTFANKVNTSKTNYKLYTFYLDKKFNEKEIKEFKDAIDVWNDALNKQIILYTYPYQISFSDFEDEILKERESIFVVKINRKSKIFNKYLIKNEVLKIALAFCDKPAKNGGNKIYVIEESVIENKIQNNRFLFIHEIGHILGSQHNKNGVMKSNPDYNVPKCIDYNALKNIANFNEININKLISCDN